MPDDNRRDQDRLLRAMDGALRVIPGKVPMVPLQGPIPGPTQAAVVEALEAYMRQAKLTQSDVADAIGQSVTYVNNLLSQSPSLPAHTRERMIRDARNWLEREARAAASKVDPDFIRTAVAERIINLAERLTERADIAIAYSPAGCDKTTSMKALLAEISTAIGITADIDTRTPLKLLDVIWRACGGRGRDRRAITLAELAEKLRMPERVSSRTLLIVDDAHELNNATLRTLVSLADRAECSVLLLGTRDLKARVSSDDDPFFGQLSSRVGIRIELAPELRAGMPGGPKSLTGGKLFTVADVRRLVAKRKLKWHPKALAMLVTIANTQRGCLRRVDRLLYWAVTACEQDGVELVQVIHVEAANAMVEREMQLPAEEQGAAEVEAATA